MAIIDKQKFESEIFIGDNVWLTDRVAGSSLEVRYIAFCNSASWNYYGLYDGYSNRNFPDNLKWVTRSNLYTANERINKLKYLAVNTHTNRKEKTDGKR